MAQPVNIEVVYALPEQQSLLQLQVAADTTAHDAIVLSGILDRHPEIDIKDCKIGIFSRVVRLEQPVHEGDRIEIYRPLIADPKVVRKQRAAAGKAMRKNPTEPKPSGN